jgi:hypothetical protein
MPASALAVRVAYRFLARQADGAPSLAKGDSLVVWIKKGDWWSEMRRGAVLEVKAVQGDIVKVHHAGWANGEGWNMKLAPGQDLAGKFKLVGDSFGRALVVMRKP